MTNFPATPADRGNFLNLRRRAKMSASAHAYVRGNTVDFYNWIRGDEVQSSIPKGPSIWICGDCHIGNLGPVADLEGKVDIQIRDLDQTVIGNPAYDILRLALSLAMASRSSDLPGVTTALMLERVTESYCSGLIGRKAKGHSRIATVRTVMRNALNRGWRHLAEERIEDVKPTIPLGPKFWKVTDEERHAIESIFIPSDDARLVSVRREKDERIKVVDAAYWLKGCSSLGRRRFAVLLRVGKKSRRKFRLMDIKEAVKPAAPASRKGMMPKNNALRVVAGAQALSPFLGERMDAAMLSGHQVVIRELRPQDLKFEFENLAQEEAVLTAGLLASVVGKAHGRQMDPAARAGWARQLRTGRSGGMNAPSWLWDSVVDLVTVHERQYLKFCRRIALKTQRRAVAKP